MSTRAYTILVYWQLFWQRNRHLRLAISRAFKYVGNKLYRVAGLGKAIETSFHCNRELRLVRRRVYKHVCKDLCNASKTVRVVESPNELRPANNLIQSGYAIEKLFLICNHKPEQFNPFSDF
jgi:hypothetical protein